MYTYYTYRYLPSTYYRNHVTSSVAYIYLRFRLCIKVILLNKSLFKYLLNLNEKGNEGN